MKLTGWVLLCAAIAATPGCRADRGDAKERATMAADSSEQACMLQFGEETIAARPLWQGRFAPSDQWLFEAEGGTCQFADGKCTIDSAGKGGATLWLRRDFPADIIIEFAATCLPPSTANNLNLFFCAASADGRPLDAITRSGDYGEYHKFPNYIFTFTSGHSRLRRDPGFEMISHASAKSSSNCRYLIRVAKTGGRIIAAIDGQRVHDVTDPAPHGRGWVGLRTWNTKVVYDHWAIYEPAGP